MAYVKTRTTKAESISTALVEAYRDEKGRPRQRVLASLHGEPDTLSALAKLAARRDALRKERDALAADAVSANKFYEVVTSNVLQGRQYSASERKEIDTLMKQRDRLLARMVKIETDLATIQRDGVVIKKHCSATDNQMQAAIKAFKQKHHDAEALVLGMEFGLRQNLKEAKAALRRLQSI
jgi:hypothetical protein